MFNLEQSIADWRKQMLAAGIKSPVPLEELESHLREEVEKQTRSGLNEQLALEIALETIGHAGTLNNEFKKAKGLKETVQSVVKNLFNAAALALPVIVLVITICLVSDWQPSGPFSWHSNARLISTDLGENAPMSQLPEHSISSGAATGGLLEMYNQFAGGQIGGRPKAPWWFQSVSIMEILLFSLVLAFAAYFQTAKNVENNRRQRRVYWIGQLLLGLSVLLGVLSPLPSLGLAMAAIICTGFVFALQSQSRTAIVSFIK